MTRELLDARELPAGTSEELAGPPEAPVSHGERLATLDVLRGVALLGILLLNVQDFAGHEALWNFPVGLTKPAFFGWHAPLDYVIVTLNWMFAEGKMRGMFSMLFGAGTVLLTERVGRRMGEHRAAVVFYRRSLWLLAFGAIHGFLIWWGDILLYYAAMALLFLYPLRRLPTRWLLTLGLLLWIVGGTIGSFGFMGVRETLRTDAEVRAAVAAGPLATPQQRATLADHQKAQEAEVAEVAAENREERLGYLAGWRNRIGQETSFVKLVFSSFFFLELLGAMTTGMGLYKAAYLTNKRPVRQYVVTACCGYAICWTIVLTGLWHVYAAHFNPVAVARWMSIPYDLEVAAGVLANTSVLLLLVRSGRLQSALAPVAAVGRTAFSNYILTSLVCKTLFSWGPWKLYGELEFYQWYIVVAAVWASNLIFSTLWLRHFAFGPLEWLWRSLTYWKPQPMRLERLA